jgi:hypothetical protein
MVRRRLARQKKDTRDRQVLGGVWLRLEIPSHGENRGSSPLGSATKINSLVQIVASKNLPYGKNTARILLNVSVQWRRVADWM